MRKHFGLRASMAAAVPVTVAVLCLGGVGGCAESKADANAQEDEQTIELSQVPAAVRETLTKEAGGAAIDELEKEIEDGKTVYEAEVKLNGRTYEIKVAEDGSLISKELEDEDDDNGEEHERDDADEKSEKGEKSAAAVGATQVAPGVSHK